MLYLLHLIEVFSFKVKISSNKVKKRCIFSKAYAKKVVSNDKLKAHDFLSFQTHTMKL